MASEVNNSEPKVLAICLNEWVDNSGLNTLSSLFSGWDIGRLAQLYTRSVLPRTAVCDRFYQISENAVLRSIFRRGLRTGRCVSNDTIPNKASKAAIERELVYYQKRSSSWYAPFLPLCREIAWFLGNWKTKELDEFIGDYDPDVLFLPVYPTVFMGIIQLYIIDQTEKPVVSYLADDNYSYRTCGVSPLKYIHRYFLRKVVKKVINQTDQLFVIAPKLKQECKDVFGIESKVLTKGVDFANLSYEKKFISSPIRMVYTGKMIYGRYQAIVSIIEGLREINRDEVRIAFDIYSTDTVSAQEKRKLDRNGAKFHGAVSLNKVQEILNSSDVAVFAEALGGKHQNIARLSFSTKITDYMSSGKCIFAVGHGELAPIEYLRDNDCAVIATDDESIRSQLEWIVQAPEVVYEYGEKAFLCAKRNHNSEELKEVFFGSLRRVAD